MRLYFGQERMAGFMIYSNVVQGSFIRRINRFVAEVSIHGRQEAVHVKNTGRLKELLIPGARVYLEGSANEARKYKHSLIAVEKNGRLVNIDSQVPNLVVYEALKDGQIAELGEPQTLRREVAYGNSRFDLYFARDEHQGYIEVKGVTLERDGVAMFPDAPTSRGRKHILEMIEVVKEGCRAVVFFLVQMQGCRCFSPHAEMDPSFAEALAEAVAAGVEVLAYDAVVSETSIRIGERLPVELTF